MYEGGISCEKDTIYDKYVQEQMIRDLFLWEYSFDSFI